MSNDIVIQEYLDLVQEIKRTTMGKYSRMAKISRATGRLSTLAAKKKKDPIYKQMVYHRDLYRKLQKQLVNKYKASVRAKAWK